MRSCRLTQLGARMRDAIAIDLSGVIARFPTGLASNNKQANELLTAARVNNRALILLRERFTNRKLETVNFFANLESKQSLAHPRSARFIKYK